jgi:hypothetical protein
MAAARQALPSSSETRGAVSPELRFGLKGGPQPFNRRSCTVGEVGFRAKLMPDMLLGIGGPFLPGVWPNCAAAWVYGFARP